MTIIYQTNAGSSKQYAEMLSKKISAPAVALSDSRDIPADEEIIFIGWLMAGKLQGLAEVRAKFINIRCICAVCMAKPEDSDSKTKVAESNQITEPLFLLPGKFNINELKGSYKMIMLMTVKMMKSKIKESNDPNADKMIAVFEEGIDMVKEDNLGEVIEFLAE